MHKIAECDIRGRCDSSLEGDCPGFRVSGEKCHFVGRSNPSRAQKETLPILLILILTVCIDVKHSVDEIL